MRRAVSEQLLKLPTVLSRRFAIGPVLGDEEDVCLANGLFLRQTERGLAIRRCTEKNVARDIGECHSENFCSI